MATQEKLVKAADRVTAAVKTRGDTGFAGIVAAPENRELRVYWKGDTPERIGDLVGRLRRDVPVSVLPAAYSARELESEMNRLVRASGGAITSIAPNVDGSGLTVSGADHGLTRSKVAGSAVPVTVEAGVTPAPASRWNGDAPWLGGAAWRNAGTGLGCSTGFAVTLGGVSWMLSAAHCGSVGQTATDPTGQVIGPIAYANTSRDVMLIRANTAGRVYNNDPAATPPEFSNPVVGTSASYVGMWLCTSGAYSGTVCLCQVKAINVTILGPRDTFRGLVRVESPTYKNAAKPGRQRRPGGDSGTVRHHPAVRGRGHLPHRHQCSGALHRLRRHRPGLLLAAVLRAVEQRDLRIPGNRRHDRLTPRPDERPNGYAGGTEERSLKTVGCGDEQDGCADRRRRRPCPVRHRCSSSARRCASLPSR
ncbi:hypothetical protein ACFSTC_00635 [Nonomuraea ferruginea]